MSQTFQRFSAEDPAALQAQIEQTRLDLAKARDGGEAARAVEAAASLGSMLTTARLEVEAKAVLVAELAAARTLDGPGPLGWLLLSLATANQYLDLRAEAGEQFAEALAIARAVGDERLEHFVLSHWGRCLVEEGAVAEARDCFTNALTLRKKLNDPRQASSQRALAEIDARWPRGTGGA